MFLELLVLILDRKWNTVRQFVNDEMKYANENYASLKISKQKYLVEIWN